MDGCGRNQVINQPTKYYKKSVNYWLLDPSLMPIKVLVGLVEFRHMVQHDNNHKLYNQKQLVNYRTREIFGKGKFSRTIQVKAIGEGNFGK